MKHVAKSGGCISGSGQLWQCRITGFGTLGELPHLFDTPKVVDAKIWDKLADEVKKKDEKASREYQFCARMIDSLAKEIDS